jgi:[CysO sulfur-carrier protein]-S-L-cysteine hydrolase
MEGQTVYIHPDAISAIVAHATAEAPRECCGLLVGRWNRVDWAAAAVNVDPAPERRFLVDPKRHIDLQRELRRGSLAVVGAYHSHPRSPAEPSPSDVEEASYPDFIHLIVSMLPPAPDVRAYRITRGVVTALRLTDVEEWQGS